VTETMLAGVVELLEIAKPGHGLRIFLIEFRYERPRTRGLRPNMRLKLTGACVGRIAFPRRRAFFSAAPPPCARGHCARSL